MRDLVIRIGRQNVPPLCGQTQLACALGKNALKMPRFLPLAAWTLEQNTLQEIITMQRFGFSLVFIGLVLILGVVGVMLTDGLAPGRVAPGFAAMAAALGGLCLVLGLYGLERGRDATRHIG
jgi:peptidoglycan/LPS O-acetylase OafA/YrhL